MKTIKELEQGCGEWCCNEGFKGHTGGLQDCQKDSLCDICKSELETLKEVLKLIDEKIEYYTMSLKDRLKLKLDFETGEAGHKVVILKILKSEIKGK